MPSRLLLGPLVALALTAGATMTARASCAVPPSLVDQIRSAAVVFVGTVEYTSDNDRVAHVRVESIWRGPMLDAYVDVHGSPVSGPFQASSVDRTYQSGVRYLFVLYSADQPLQDNSCSSTQPYTSDLAALSPDSAKTPSPPTALQEIQNFGTRYGWLGGLIALTIAGAATALVIRRRHKRSA